MDVAIVPVVQFEVSWKFKISGTMFKKRLSISKEGWQHSAVKTGSVLLLLPSVYPESK